MKSNLSPLSLSGPLLSKTYSNPKSRRRGRVSRLFSKDSDVDEGGGVSENSERSDDEDEPLGAAGKKALLAEREDKKRISAQLKEMQAKLKQFGDFAPEDLEDLKKLKEEKEKTEEEKLKKQQNYEEAIANRERKYKQDLDALTQTANDYRGKYETLVIESAIAEAFFEAGGKRGDGEGLGPKAFAQLLIPQIKGQIQLEDGEIVVIDKAGDPRFNKDTGKDYTLLDLMQECRKGATGVLFESINNGAGTGMNSPARRRYTNNQMVELQRLKPAARIAEARKRGLA